VTTAIVIIPAMTSGLTFAFKLDPAEQVRVSRVLRQRAGRLWRWVGLPFLALPLVLVIALDRPLAMLLPYGIILMLAGSLIALSPTIQRWQVRRAFAAAPNLQALTYRFTESGLELTTAVSSGLLAWEGVTEAL
jgi:ABC-type molybdate transport system permease subunit